MDRPVRMATNGGRGVPFGCAPVDQGRGRSGHFPKGNGFLRARLSRRGRVHGPRQLGDISGRGSRFGYALLTVALISNIMAIVLQSLCARLAIASGRDLAQACRDAYPKPVAMVLWLLAEIAIIATDIAEVIGTAIGLNLLFGIPLELGVVITALDVFLILYLQKLGFRWSKRLS